VRIILLTCLTRSVIRDIIISRVMGVIIRILSVVTVFKVDRVTQKIQFVMVLGKS
jgi:hypothetical protein